MSQKNNIKIKKVLVVGLGLIGASLCRDLKKNSNYEKIYGHDIDTEVMSYALNNNYVHEIRKDLEEGIKGSDLIILCTPVHSITKVLDVVKYFFNGDKVFTDTLSSKGSIFNFLTNNKLLDTKNFILSHPMAGTENFGIKNSKENLFQEANTFILPLKFITVSLGLGAFVKRIYSIFFFSNSFQTSTDWSYKLIPLWSTPQISINKRSNSQIITYLLF